MKINRKIFAAVFILFITVIFCRNGYSLDEKSAIRNSYFGNFVKANIIKKEGKITLKRWEPYVQHTRSLPGPYIEPEGIDKLSVTYDEIWIKVNNDDFPQNMRIRLKGQFDINKLYWKNNKVQASTLEKYYLSNPVTGANLTPAAHKVVIIYGREDILNRIK